MLINLAIIIASIIILVLILNHFKDTQNASGYLQRIIGPTLLLVFGLLSLFIFLIIAVFQTKSKRVLYKSSFRDLQFEMIKYNQKVEDYAKISRTKLFRKKIALIKDDVKNTKKKKITFNRLVKSVLLKDPND
jgi:Mn2+/Fe2+ NRAMP family transporter